MSREFAPKIGELFGGFFSGDSGDFLVRGGKGGFSMSWRDSADVFETQQGTPTQPPLDISLNCR